MAKNYTVILDETCKKHGGHNFIYRYHNENFDRIESFCEGCAAQYANTPIKSRRTGNPRPTRPPRK